MPENYRHRMLKDLYDTCMENTLIKYENLSKGKSDQSIFDWLEKAQLVSAIIRFENNVQWADTEDNKESVEKVMFWFTDMLNRTAKAHDVSLIYNGYLYKSCKMHYHLPPLSLNDQNSRITFIRRMNKILSLYAHGSVEFTYSNPTVNDKGYVELVFYFN